MDRGRLPYSQLALLAAPLPGRAVQAALITLIQHNLVSCSTSAAAVVHYDVSMKDIYNLIRYGVYAYWVEDAVAASNMAKPASTDARDVVSYILENGKASVANVLEDFRTEEDAERALPVNLP